MRLWTIHPRHLDARGLVALWREGLLARAVLAGRTAGYRHHPQLARFRAHAQPLAAIDAYLGEVWKEAERRGYAFDRAKIELVRVSARIAETRGQVSYEWGHLRKKLRARDAAAFRAAERERAPEVHPLFRLVAGGVRAWERAPAQVTGSRAAPSRRRRAAPASPRGS